MHRPLLSAETVGERERRLLSPSPVHTHAHWMIKTQGVSHQQAEIRRADELALPTSPAEPRLVLPLMRPGESLTHCCHLEINKLKYFIF